MRWILRLVETDGEGESGCLDVMDIVRPDELGDVTGANFRAEGESESGKCDSSYE